MKRLALLAACLLLAGCASAQSTAVVRVEAEPHREPSIVFEARITNP